MAELLYFASFPSEVSVINYPCSYERQVLKSHVRSFAVQRTERGSAWERCDATTRRGGGGSNGAQLWASNAHENIDTFVSAHCDLCAESATPMRSATSQCALRNSNNYA